MVCFSFLTLGIGLGEENGAESSERVQLERWLKLYSSGLNERNQCRNYFLKEGEDIIPSILKVLKADPDWSYGPVATRAIYLVSREARMSDDLKKRVRVVYLDVLDRSLNQATCRAILSDLPNFDRGNSEGANVLLKVAVTNPDLAPRIANQLEPMGDEMLPELAIVYEAGSDELRFRLNGAFSCCSNQKLLSIFTPYLEKGSDRRDVLSGLRVLEHASLPTELAEAIVIEVFKNSDDLVRWAGLKYILPKCRSEFVKKLGDGGFGEPRRGIGMDRYLLELCQAKKMPKRLTPISGYNPEAGFRTHASQALLDEAYEAFLFRWKRAGNTRSYPFLMEILLELGNHKKSEVFLKKFVQEEIPKKNQFGFLDSRFSAEMVQRVKWKLETLVK